MRIIISGGGTSGHISPGIALAETVAALPGEHSILWVGTRDRIEAEIVPAAGYDFQTIRIRGLQRSFSPVNVWRNLKLLSLMTTLTPFREARRIIKDFRPDIVLGTGGYVCLPTLLTARMTGYPTVMLEINVYPGLATRLLARHVSRVALGFEETAKYLHKKAKWTHVGVPVRPDILTTSRDDGRNRFGVPADAPVLLVFGGSLGARALNQALVGALDGLMQIDNLHVIHGYGSRPGPGQTGDPGKYGGRYISMEFIDNMDCALAAADLVVSRAGASAIAEIAARGLPSILIPWKGSAAGHQEKNATELFKAGAVEMITDDELSSFKLYETIAGLFARPERMRELGGRFKSVARTDAANRLLDLVRREAAKNVENSEAR